MRGNFTLFVVLNDEILNLKLLVKSDAQLVTLWYIGLIRSNLEYSSPVLYTTNDYVKKRIFED